MYYIVQRYIGYEKMPQPPTLDPVLNNNSWEDIQWAVQHGVASDTWAVGDRKAVVLNGTVGSKTFNNQTVYAYILGFNHNATLEGDNTLHFHFGFNALSGGTHIAFCDSYYESTGGGFRMNTSATNSGGWESSYMRNTLIPAFINAMPSDLQAVLKTVNKYTDNAVNVSKHDQSSYVTATSDKVFLLTDNEIRGSYAWINQYERNSQAQYDYYKNGNSWAMYNDTSPSTSTDVRQLTRSPANSNDVKFCNVRGSGSGTADANYSYAFAPAFVVG